ncbi:ABC transporter substrate-binding protein [Collinsella sp. AGMB00827]|uniref:ABC transporter substrate-binding protein n=1 Tax=Collinsella ureilytica TaxID=2869515 RepID=A0ABS7MHM6_9ACTN|nr:ABC transporter substrate-binding protein [Collinsella urealyticum]MBY4796856.1 ABC transporter substrate-binding protein [Collinsella urealyticum]
MSDSVNQHTTNRVSPAPTRRHFVVGAAAAFAAVAGGSLLAGCGQTGSKAAGSAEKKDGTSLVIALGSSNEPEGGFDPCLGWGSSEHVHEPLIQSTLIVTDKDMNIVNDLVTEYSVADDGLMWTFKIRDDIKFTDGKPLKASDVAFTLNTIRTSDKAEADLTMIDNVEAVSDTEVRIHLNKPYNALIYTLAVIGIVPEHAYGPTYGDKPIGSGRYKLAQWDHGQQAIFEANPDYYGDAPKIKRFTVVFMDEDAALAAVKAGKVDMAFTSAIHASQTVDGYRLEAFKSVDSRGINLPVIPAGSTRVSDGESYPAGNDVTCHKEIRQAMNMALDRKALIDNVLGGYGEVAYSIGDGMPWANPEMKVEYDPDQARKIMEDAGWKQKDGIYEKDGKQAEFTLYYSTSDPVRQGLSNEFARQMGEVGIKVNAAGHAWDDIFPHSFSDPIMWGWGSNAPSDIYGVTYSTSDMNFSCYENPVSDAYIDQALATKTIEESYPLWQKAEWDGTTGPAPQGDAAWLWFTNIDHLYWVSDGLTVAEQKLHPHGHGWSVLNNVDAWSWG